MPARGRSRSLLVLRDGGLHPVVDLLVGPFGRLDALARSLLAADRLGNPRVAHHPLLLRITGARMDTRR